MWKRTGDKKIDRLASPTPMLALIVLATVAFGGCEGDAPGAWGPGSCGPVGSPAFVRPRVMYPAPLTWYYPADWKTSGKADLYRGNVYAGRYDYFTGIFAPFTGQPYHPTDWPVWERRKNPPCDCNPKCRCDAGLCQCKSGYLCSDECTCAQPKPIGDVKPIYNGGLMQEQINGHRERWLVGEKEVEPTVALEAAGADLPDWSGKLRVVVVDADQTRRRQVESDLATHPSLKPLTKDAIVQGYGPDHWHMQDLATKVPAFKTDGAPTLYVQAPLGKVLYRQDGYQGPEHLARHMAGALRRADPKYDPSKDPGPQAPPAPAPPAPAPPAPPGPGEPSIPACLWAFGAALLVMIGDAILALRKGLS